MNSETYRANRRAAWRWGGLVVSLLGLQVAGGIMAIVLATGDQSVAVVPNYHQKALDWDAEMALQAASRSLGWTCQISEIKKSSSVPSGLRIRLHDRDGQPIEVLSGELEIYRHARASDVRRVKIPAGSFGVIELAGCFEANGLWQVSVDVRDRSGNRFAHSEELNIGALGSDSMRKPESR